MKAGLIKLFHQYTPINSSYRSYRSPILIRAITRNSLVRRTLQVKKKKRRRRKRKVVVVVVVVMMMIMMMMMIIIIIIIIIMCCINILF
jgi:subtilase family serine protease